VTTLLILGLALGVAGFLFGAMIVAIYMSATRPKR
jgi:hypothetical protein